MNRRSAKRSQKGLQKEGVSLWLFGLIWLLKPTGHGPFRALALRVVIEPLAERGAGGPLGGLLAVSGVAQAAGVLIFVGWIWSRVRGIGKEA